MAEKSKVAALQANDEIVFTQFEYVDQAGTVRGKLANTTDMTKEGAYAAAVNGVRGNEEIVMTPLAGLMDGFNKRPVVQDPDTAFQMSWRPNTAAILGNMTHPDGSPHDHDVRTILQQAEDKLKSLGYETKVGWEYEFYVFEDDRDAIRAGDIKNLGTIGSNRNAYSLARQNYLLPIIEEFFHRMNSTGAPLEYIHTEYSRGMYEYTTVPISAVASADGLARGRLYLRELLNEQGLTSTAMTALWAVEDPTHSGIHANVSLWKDGENVFWDGEGLSEIGKQFLAGVMSTMQDFHLIFRPWVNSYRRFDPEAFCPCHVAWGEDNHFVSVRVSSGIDGGKKTRVEHRVAGTDTCPHLVLAAILYGGIHGIENRLEPQPGIGLEEIEDAELLTNTLPDAIARFKESKIARGVFGDAFVEHYCQVREEEWAEYEEWCNSQDIEIDHNGPEVTEWEYKKYFDWLV